MKAIQNLSIRGYYRSTYLFPSLFLGGCVTGLNDNIANCLLNKYHAFQMESGKKLYFDSYLKLILDRGARRFYQRKVH